MGKDFKAQPLSPSLQGFSCLCWGLSTLTEFLPHNPPKAPGSSKPLKASGIPHKYLGSLHASPERPWQPLVLDMLCLQPDLGEGRAPPGAPGAPFANIPSYLSNVLGAEALNPLSEFKSADLTAGSCSQAVAIGILSHPPLPVSLNSNFLICSSPLLLRLSFVSHVPFRWN